MPDTARMLEVDDAVVGEALANTLAAEELERDAASGQTLIYLPGLLGAEKGIASRILRLAGQPSPDPEIDLDRAVAWDGRQSERTLSASQR